MQDDDEKEPGAQDAPSKGDGGVAEDVPEPHGGDDEDEAAEQGGQEQQQKREKAEPEGKRRGVEDLVEEK